MEQLETLKGKKTLNWGRLDIEAGQIKGEHSWVTSEQQHRWETASDRSSETAGKILDTDLLDGEEVT